MAIELKNKKYEDFTSFIFPCNSIEAINSLNIYLSKWKDIIENDYSDIEIIILVPLLLENYLQNNLDIENKLKDNSYILTLSNWENWDSSVLTGLARANGDMIFILDPFCPNIFKKLSSIKKDYLTDSDIYLFKNKYSNANFVERFSSFLLFTSLRFISTLPISHLDRREMILSRRSVNYILKNGRRNILLSEIAYRSSYPYKKLTISKEINEVYNESFSNKRKVQWSMLMRLSNLPSKISAISIMILIFFVLIASSNALLVRFFGVNLLLNKEVYIPGWTYLVIVIASTSLLLSLSMYSLQQSLNVIHDELNKKDFEVNSYKRF